MQRILPSLLTLVCGLTWAQPNPYLTDLATLKSVLQKTPSFKAQITGRQLTAYDSLYQHLAQDTLANPLSFRYFANLAQLLFPIRDNHLGFMQTSDYRHFRTQASLDSFVISKEFLVYPVYPINLDSLEAQLAQSPLDSLEGIYHYGSHYTVGVFRSGPHTYTGVVVKSDSKLWRKG